MLMNDGYTRQELATMAPLMKGLAGWPREGRSGAGDVELSRALLARLAELESAHEELRGDARPAWAAKRSATGAA